jgi:hypothetical protein
MFTAVMRLLSGKSCSWNNPGLKRTRISAIFKKFHMIMIVESKINLIRKTILRVYTMKLYAGLPNLVRLSL